MLDGVIRRDTRRWGREPSLGVRPAGKPVRRRGCEASACGGVLGETPSLALAIFGLRFQGTGSAQAGSEAGEDSRARTGAARGRALGTVHRPIRRGVEHSPHAGCRVESAHPAPNARFPGCPDAGTFRRPVHHGGSSTPPPARAMTSAARTAASPSSCTTRTRTPARASLAGRARARPLASALLGGLAGVVAAMALAAVAPAVGRGAIDDIDRITPRANAVVRDREPASPPVASVLTPARAVDAMPASDPAQARP